MRRFIRGSWHQQYPFFSTSSRLEELRARLKNERPQSGFVFGAATSRPPAPSVVMPDVALPSPEDSESAVFSPLLFDRFNRFHTYLRISLTERCNLRCQYCMPAEGVNLLPPNEMLTTEEIVKLASFFVDHGVRKIRLTGGEPLVRSGLVEMMERLSSLRSRNGQSLESIGVTTNGLKLERMLPQLIDAGLTSVNISLDTLQEKRFEAITRRRGFANVRRAIDAAVASATKSSEQSGESVKELRSVKVNVVVMRGVNEDELKDFVGLTKHSPLDVRFIEWMPFDSNEWDDGRFVSYKEMLDLLASDQGIVELERCDSQEERASSDTTKWYRARGHQGRVGFITSMSEHFCGTCNRLRITADGKIKACLFGEHEVDLRTALREPTIQGQRESLIVCVRSALRHKHFSLGGHTDMYAISKGQNRPMIRIGG